MHCIGGPGLLLQAFSSPVPAAAGNSDRNNLSAPALVTAYHAAPGQASAVAPKTSLALRNTRRFPPGTFNGPSQTRQCRLVGSNDTQLARQVNGIGARRGGLGRGWRADSNP